VAFIFSSSECKCSFSSWFSFISYFGPSVLHLFPLNTTLHTPSPHSLSSTGLSLAHSHSLTSVMFNYLSLCVLALVVSFVSCLVIPRVPDASNWSDSLEVCPQPDKTDLTLTITPFEGLQHIPHSIPRQRLSIQTLDIFLRSVLPPAFGGFCSVPLICPTL
jgi:hypothetical protein